MFKSETTIQPTTPPKDPIIALLLSLLLFGGAGQIYLGQQKKGIIIIAVTILLSCVGIGFIVWIAGIIDAYMLADKLKKGQPIGDMEFFWESKS